MDDDLEPEQNAAVRLHERRDMANRSLPRAWELLGVVGLLGSACGTPDGGHDGGSDACAAMITRLRECGLVTAGTLNCGDTGLTLTSCELECIRSVSCADVQSAFCARDLSGMLRCYQQCEPVFQCADASRTIAMQGRCDGWNDCADGSDEQGCPPDTVFECADGSVTIPWSLKCDGLGDCADGSDELDCPAEARFDCADGSESVRESLRCDGFESCLDGSDESGCSTDDWFQCADGSRKVHPLDVCDLDRECQDGSDEAQGCASVEPSCVALKPE